MRDVCVCIYLFMFVFVIFLYLFVYLFKYVSIHLFIYVFIYVFMYLFFNCVPFYRFSHSSNPTNNYFFTNNQLLISCLNHSSHEWKQTCAIKSISSESGHTDAVVTTWEICTGSVLTAVHVVHSTFVYVWNMCERREAHQLSGYVLTYIQGGERTWRSPSACNDFEKLWYPYAAVIK